MNNAKAKQQPEINECRTRDAFEEFKKFMQHHVEHDVRMLLDRKGNYYALFCAVCEPQMTDAMETRH
jgi:hypothetical protein